MSRRSTRAAALKTINYWYPPPPDSDDEEQVPFATMPESSTDPSAESPKKSSSSKKTANRQSEDTISVLEESATDDEHPAYPESARKQSRKCTPGPNKTPLSRGGVPVSDPIDVQSSDDESSDHPRRVLTRKHVLHESSSEDEREFDDAVDPMQEDSEEKSPQDAARGVKETQRGSHSTEEHQREIFPSISTKHCEAHEKVVQKPPAASKTSSQEGTKDTLCEVSLDSNEATRMSPHPDSSPKDVQNGSHAVDEEMPIADDDSTEDMDAKVCVSETQPPLANHDVTLQTEGDRDVGTSSSNRQENQEFISVPLVEQKPESLPDETMNLSGHSDGNSQNIEITKTTNESEQLVQSKEEDFDGALRDASERILTRARPQRNSYPSNKGRTASSKGAKRKSLGDVVEVVSPALPLQEKSSSKPRKGFSIPVPDFIKKSFKGKGQFPNFSDIYREYYGLEDYEGKPVDGGYDKCSDDELDMMKKASKIDGARFHRSFQVALSLKDLCPDESLLDPFLEICDRIQSGRSFNGLFDSPAKASSYLREVALLWNREHPDAMIPERSIPIEAVQADPNMDRGRQRKSAHDANVKFGPRKRRSVSVYDGTTEQESRKRRKSSMANKSVLTSSPYIEKRNALFEQMQGIPDPLIFSADLTSIYHSGRSPEECRHARPNPLPFSGGLPSIPSCLEDLVNLRKDSERIFEISIPEDSCLSPDQKYEIGKFMERDDIVVVFKNILKKGDSEWDHQSRRVSTKLKERLYHKVKQFRRREKSESAFDECSGYVSMRSADFIRYIGAHNAREKEKAENPSAGDYKYFRFQKWVSDADNDKLGHFKDERIDLDNDVLYAIDVDLPTHAPKHAEQFRGDFQLPEILPGGDWCLMNELPPTTRPFMGPNFYATVGGSYTHLHQDGHGTVDSGHCVLHGFNEVIMLRRMPERHKAYACQLAKPTSSKFDPLYGLPHSDEGGQKPDWPTNAIFEQWKKQNYYPIRLILGPGEMLHINKGRLHAFRKMRVEALPPSDCHYELRKQIIETKGLKTTQPCFSVAYDWMFSGVTPDGIRREISSMIECSYLNRKNGVKSLAVPQIAILEMAKTLNLNPDSENQPRSGMDVARGILPALQHVVEQARAAQDYGKSCSSVTALDLPDAHQDPMTFSIDPHGCDYFCKKCHLELSNVFFHCVGCEKAEKDYNICYLCHRKNRHKEQEGIHLPKPNPKKSCTCKDGDKVCNTCSRCVTCSHCACHGLFEMHWRMDSLGTLEDVVEEIALAVGESQLRLNTGTKLLLDLASLDSTLGLRESVWEDIASHMDRTTGTVLPEVEEDGQQYFNI